MTALLVSMLTAPLLGVQVAPPIFDVNYPAMERSGGTAIVRVLDKGQPSTVRRDGTESTVLAQRAEVLSSAIFASGATVLLLRSGTSKGIEPDQLEVAHSYLVVGAGVQAGEGLLQAQSLPGLAADSHIEADVSKAIFVCGELPTSLSTLHAMPGAGWTTAYSVVDCLQHGTVGTWRQVCDAVENCTPSLFDDRAALFSKPKHETPYMNYLFSVGRQENSPYLLAKLYRMANRWLVVGTYDKFLRSLLDSAACSESFTDDDRALSLPDYCEVSGEHTVIKEDEWFKAVMATHSVPLRRFLIECCIGVRFTNVQEKTLSAMLESPDSDTRCYLAQHYAQSEVHVKMAPDRVLGLDGFVHYERLDECVAFWIDYWAKR